MTQREVSSSPPLAKSWTLETPAWNQRTRYFYEKAGFTIVDISFDPQAGWGGVNCRKVP